jgi:hypothetical protein
VLAGIRASEADIARMLDMATAAAEEASMRRYELLAQVPMRFLAFRKRVFHDAIEFIGHHPFVNLRVYRICMRWSAETAHSFASGNSNWGIVLAK